MGNTASSQQPVVEPRLSRRRSILGTLSTTNATATDSSLRHSTARSLQQNTTLRRRSNISSTIGRHGLARLPAGYAVAAQSPGLDDVGDEPENRPLVNRRSSMLQDGLMVDTAVEPSSRRQSRMSRLGSRLLPDTVARGLLSSGEETTAEGQALRHGSLAHTRSADWSRETRAPESNWFSLVGSLRRRAEPRTEPRRRPIRGPFPMGHNEHQLLPEMNLRRASMDMNEGSLRNETRNAPNWQRRNRLSRVRDALSLRLPNLLYRSHGRARSDRDTLSPPTRPLRLASANDSDHLLPPLTNIDHRLDLDETPHELDAVEPETTNALSSAAVTAGMSTIRRFPQGLRSRSTRLIRRGEHPPLSQVLQLAAAAIAAQLSGHALSTAGDRSRMVGGDAFDGSIQNFVQTLQDAASAQAGANVDLNATDGELPPVNFMRVFQFPNDENGSPITSQGQARDVNSVDMDTMGGVDGERSVTLVLVGVRSMPHTVENNGSGATTLGPSLDTLLSLPFLPPANMLRNGSSGALFRRSDARTRTHSRRHSMTNYSFPAQFESQRHQRARTSAGRGSSEHASITPAVTSTATPISDSPPGPHPPPSTPADIRSGYATPVQRPSSASALPVQSMPDLDENQERQPRSNTESSFNTARQRRRSDSEFARRPELSSGAARRNGVVEPDHPPAGVGRSWLIYVVGTNVSPDHPAFTMPSLFTDNPSYEDMQMLSTLLGPVKPPVATQEDVNSAGGIYRLVVRGDHLVAVSTESDSMPFVTVARSDRCLVCLCEYEADDEVRQLDKCTHMYHRECIDEVSSTPLEHEHFRILIPL